MIRLVTEPPPGIPQSAVPHAVPTRPGVRGGPTPSADDAVARKHTWLSSHTGGFVGRVWDDGLLYAARVGDVEVARAYDDMLELMNLVDQAESAGRCPLHPPAGPS